MDLFIFYLLFRIWYSPSHRVVINECDAIGFVLTEHVLCLFLYQPALNFPFHCKVSTEHDVMVAFWNTFLVSGFGHRHTEIAVSFSCLRLFFQLTFFFIKRYFWSASAMTKSLVCIPCTLKVNSVSEVYPISTALTFPWPWPVTSLLCTFYETFALNVVSAFFQIINIPLKKKKKET